MTQNTTSQKVDIQQMPTTPEELRVYISHVLRDILSIPENVIQLAQNVFAAAANATQVQRERDLREGLRPVLSRTYYQGSLRATVSQPTEGSPMVVGLEFIPEDEKEWKDATIAIAESAREALSKLVLSQPTFPGDVWYVTTNAAVNAQLEKVTDYMMGEGGIETNTEAKPLDLDQVAADIAKQTIQE